MLSTFLCKSLRKYFLVKLTLYFCLLTIYCALIAHNIFKIYSGISIPFLITLTAAPLFFRISLIQPHTLEVSKKSCKHRKFGFLLYFKYKEIIKLSVSFFVGVFLGTIFLVLFLPENFIREIFYQQYSTVLLYIPSTKNLFHQKLLLSKIVLHNLTVVYTSFILSLLFGIGYLIILSWNATLAGVFFGVLLRSNFSIFVKTSFIFPHFFIEILAYLFSGIGGSIFSLTFPKISEEEKIEEILKDSLLFLTLSVFLIFLAGIMEMVTFQFLL